MLPLFSFAYESSDFVSPRARGIHYMLRLKGDIMITPVGVQASLKIEEAYKTFLNIRNGEAVNLGYVLLSFILARSICGC